MDAPTIPERILTEIFEHACEDKPNECCGILAGVNGEITKIYRARNSEQSPHRYVIAPPELKKYYDELTRLGLEVIAVYHSHPSSGPEPSDEDVTLWSWEGAYMVICGFSGGGTVEIMCYWVEDGGAEDVGFCVTTK